jgi:hypothetical protein
VTDDSNKVGQYRVVMVAVLRVQEMYDHLKMPLPVTPHRNMPLDAPTVFTGDANPNPIK